MGLFSFEIQPEVTFSSGANARLRHRLQSSRCLEPIQLSRLCHFSLGSLTLTATPNPELPITREEIDLNGTLLAIDWLDPVDALSTAPAGVLLLFPGIGTNSRRGFTGMTAHHLAKSFPRHKVGVAVLQGHDGLPLKSTCFPATAYVSIGDTGRLIEHVSRQFPGLPMVVVACSIGAAHFTHWAGSHPEKVKQCGVVGAVLVCHGTAARPAATAVDSSGAAPFILEAYRDILRTNFPDLTVFQDIPGFDPAKLSAARTLREWDEAVLPLYGFQRHEDVLDAVDTTPQMMRALPMPTVFLGAANDPITPSTRLLEGGVHQLVSDCAVIHCSHGSHMAWWQPVAGNPLHLEQNWVRDLMVELISILADLPHPTEASDASETSPSETSEEQRVLSCFPCQAVLRGH
eukprot:s4314_g2.t1